MSKVLFIQAAANGFIVREDFGSSDCTEVFVFEGVDKALEHAKGRLTAEGGETPVSVKAFTKAPSEQKTTEEAPAVSTGKNKAAKEEKPPVVFPEVKEEPLTTDAEGVNFETLRKQCTANIQRLALTKRARVVEILASFNVAKLPQLGDENLSALAVKLEECDAE